MSRVDGTLVEDDLELLPIELDTRTPQAERYTDVDVHRTEDQGDGRYQDHSNPESNAQRQRLDGVSYSSFTFLPQYPRLLDFPSLQLKIRRLRETPRLSTRVIVMIIAGITVCVVAWMRRPASPASEVCSATSKWHGWPSVDYAFIFGDSWTETGFDPEGEQPSLENPLGNFGSNSANATNWVGFMTSKYNASRVRTYNFAAGGATLDNYILQGYPVPIEQQIYYRFMAKHATAVFPPWTGSNSIFIISTGIVDLVVMNKYRGIEETAAINSKLTAMYSKLVHSLYGVGARNIVLMTTPPMSRTFFPPDNEDVKAKFKIDVAEYNRRIKAVAQEVAQYDDANVWVFDLFSMFSQALDNPKAYVQTSQLKNTTEFCLGYFGGTPTIDYFDPTCYVPVNQYMWLDALHPTYPVHDALADQLVEALKGGPNVC